MDEKQKMLQRRQEDLRFVQSIWCVVIGLALEFLLFQVKNQYFNLMSTVAAVECASLIATALEWTRVGALGFLVVGVLWVVTKVYGGSNRIFTPMCVIFSSMVLGAVSHGILLYGEKGLNILLFLVPAWAGLGLVFFLYQVEFFIAAFLTSLGGVGLWLYRQMMVTAVTEYEVALVPATQTTFYVFLNTTLVIVLGVFYLVNKAYQQEGILTIRGQEFVLIADMKDGSSLWLVGLSGLATFLSLALALGLGSWIAYYAIYGLLGWLFVLLVYFTVKMM